MNLFRLKICIFRCNSADVSENLVMFAFGAEVLAKLDTILKNAILVLNKENCLNKIGSLIK